MVAYLGELMVSLGMVRCDMVLDFVFTELLVAIWIWALTR
jgi:hypothetical protein